MIDPMPLSLVDIGANLADPSFDSDRDRVIDRAVAAGVTRIVVTGNHVEGSRAALAVARRRPGTLSCTAGVHPHHATTHGAGTIEELRRLAGEAGVVAIGECGLDFFRDLSPRPVQLECLEAQIELAAELGLPLFLHERDAHQAMVSVLQSKRVALPRAVIHCFTGGVAELRAYLDLDLHIGITGWVCDERRGGPLREALPHVPLARLMLETDAPYLLPRTLRPRPSSRRNEPANLPWVLEAVAQGLGQPAAVVAEATTRNAERFFGLGSSKYGV
jgi:TatD DNase family protein